MILVDVSSVGTSRKTGFSVRFVMPHWFGKITHARTRSNFRRAIAVLMEMRRGSLEVSVRDTSHGSEGS